MIVMTVCRPLAISVLTVACVSPTAYESSAFRKLQGNVHDHAVNDIRNPAPSRSPSSKLSDDHTLAACLIYAMRHNPELEAAFEDWRSAVYAIADQREMPDLSIEYSTFIRRVETRVGPQRHRFRLRQVIPWPAKRRFKASAAKAAAEASERKFDAEMSRIRQHVAQAYWRVWQVQRTRALQRLQRQLLAEISLATRALVELGNAPVGALMQIDLELSRRDDAIAHLDAEDQIAIANLKMAMGAPPDLLIQIASEPPPIGLPLETVEELRALAKRHPRVEQHAAMAQASDGRARAERARGLPDFALGLEYIETGRARQSDVPDSGKDPVMLTLSMTLPVWRGQYRNAERTARARAAAHRARGRQAENISIADIETSLSRMRHSTHRETLYQHTLIPQAEATLSAYLGSYRTGDATLIQVLTAQQRVLDVRLARIRIRTIHATARAQLEHAIGRPISVHDIKDINPDHQHDNRSHLSQ